MSEGSTWAIADEIRAAVQRWAYLYNTDVHRMIDECYAESFHVLCPGLLEITDKAHFHEIEQAVLDADSTRRLHLTDVVAADDRVVVECVLRGGGTRQWETFCCAILTFKDGQIINDHTYLDRTQWPGLRDHLREMRQEDE
ncbi:nuclear transport factor 2 family protein [Streptomyces sp. NPDC007205]|uniref:nuclear transport factor 2 family protein n=1 Tax=Streptomyces sp. NPDC007205 TaxID=3154316 RepID=UPI0033D1D7F7